MALPQLLSPHSQKLNFFFCPAFVLLLFIILDRCYTRHLRLKDRTIVDTNEEIAFVTFSLPSSVLKEGEATRYFVLSGSIW